MACDRGLLPFAAGGGEHVAEFGDCRGVRAFGPLMQHVRLGFGQRRGRREGEGKSSGGSSLDREHRFSPVSEPSRSLTSTQRIPFGFLVFDAHVAGALLFFKLDSQWRQTRRGLRIDQSKSKARAQPRAKAAPFICRSAVEAGGRSSRLAAFFPRLKR